MTTTTARRLAAAAMIAAATATVAPAAAEEAPLAPTSCAGLTFEDPTGDAYVNAVPVSGTVGGQPFPPQAPVPAGDNVDLTQGYFVHAPNAKGTNVLTAVLRVKNMSKTPGAGGSQGLFYSMNFTISEDGADVGKFVAATIVGESVSYSYGTAGQDGYTTEGQTTGRIIDGENGAIEIVVPVAPMKLTNKSLGSPNGNAANIYGDPSVGPYFFPANDVGPDGGEGKAFKVAPCGEAGVPTPAEPTTPGVSTPAPGGGGGSAPQQGAPQQSGLGITVTVPKLSAKKIAKKKGFAVKLSSSGKVTGLKATLLKGRKTVGKGALASVEGSATLKLKTAKTFKKGTYTLRLTGTNAAGQTSSAQVQMKVAK